MVNIKRLKMYMATAECLSLFDKEKQTFIEEFKAVAILDDMSGPTGINAGKTMIARVFRLSGEENDASLARTLLRLMYSEGHNAIAFYEIDETKVRFATLKI